MIVKPPLLQVELGQVGHLSQVRRFAKFSSLFITFGTDFLLLKGVSVYASSGLVGQRTRVFPVPDPDHPSPTRREVSQAQG
jgi:hypothetical protein